MKQIKGIIILAFVALIHFSVSAQAYLKIAPTSESFAGAGDGSLDLLSYGTTGPYMITWWDNTWSPGTGLRAENLSAGKIFTIDLVDMNCKRIHAHIYLDPDSTKQVTLDTVIINMPSGPGMNDGSLEFHLNNVQPGYSRAFSNSGGGGITTDSIFTGLDEDYYTYSIGGPFGVAYEVHVSMHLPTTTMLGPCEPLIDSSTFVSPSTTTSCNGEIHMKNYGSSTGVYYRYVYMPMPGGGSSQINSNIYDSIQTGLCPGPYLIDTYSTLNNYWIQSPVYIDDPGIADSTWGEPPMDTILVDSMLIDTIVLAAATNCGIDYSAGVDTAYVSDYYSIMDDYFGIVVTVIQGTDTINTYATASIDTSHVICFDITLFCADSSLLRSGGSYSKRNIVFLKPYINYLSVNELNPRLNLATYPNPFSTTVTVNADFTMQRIIVYGVDGKMIQQFYVNDKRIDLNLQQLQPSVYFMKVVGANKEEATIRLVKL